MVDEEEEEEEDLLRMSKEAWGGGLGRRLGREALGHCAE